MPCCSALATDGLPLTGGARRATTRWRGTPEAVGKDLRENTSKEYEPAKKLAQLCLVKSLCNHRGLSTYDLDGAGSVMLDGSVRCWLRTVVEVGPKDEDYEHFNVVSTPGRHPAGHAAQTSARRRFSQKRAWSGRVAPCRGALFLL